MQYKIKLSDGLLELITLTAVESYCFGDGRKVKQVESFGYVWGSIKQEDEETIFYLDRGSVSLSALKAPGSVIPNQRAAQLKNEVVLRWSPHLTLLGDFHTHPYQDLDEVREKTGFDFSDADFDSFLCDDYKWETSSNKPVMLAMTICKMKRVHDTGWGNMIRRNVCQFDVGEFRFWLNAATGFLDADDERSVTGNTHSCVLLDLNSRFFNSSGDRIQSLCPDNY